MDNAPEGENKQIEHNWQDDQQKQPDSVLPPVSSIPPLEPNNASPANALTSQSDTSHATTLIMQWLTYAFWGWTILTLAVLIFSFFQRLIVGDDTSTTIHYVIAGLIVLLPISFVCDTIYSRKEPDRKTGAASLIMVIHAVIFALFAIGSLLFAAWSVASLATGSGNDDNSTPIAYLCASIVVGVFYAAAFARTLNPSHIRWIPKVYRLTMVGTILLFAILGAVQPTFHNADSTKTSSATSSYGNNNSSATSKSRNTFDSKGKLEPSVVGGTQCDIPTLSDGSTTGQVAIAGGAKCGEAETNIQSATSKNGGNYTANGYNCTSTRQSSNTQWSSYWNNNFYSYNCTSGSKQVAFNLQTKAQDQSSPSPTTR